MTAKCKISFHLFSVMRKIQKFLLKVSRFCDKVLEHSILHFCQFSYFSNLILISSQFFLLFEIYKIGFIDHITRNPDWCNYFLKNSSPLINIRLWKVLNKFIQRNCDLNVKKSLSRSKSYQSFFFFITHTFSVFSCYAWPFHKR